MSSDNPLLRQLKNADKVCITTQIQESHSSDLFSLCWTLWLLPQIQHNRSHGERTRGSPEVLWAHGERTALPALLKLTLQTIPLWEKGRS